MSILVVEDNPISAKILDINLQENGYEVVVKYNGVEALSEMKKNPDINLIITDVMMPEMDGLQFISTIKQNAHWKKIPFIIASAMSNKKTVKQAIEMGCKHFIVKPIKSAQLIQLIKDILPNQRLIIRDKNKVAAEMGLNIASYQKIAKMFVKFLEKEIENLSNEIAEGKYKNFSIDLAQLRESASTLKAERVLDILDKIDPDKKDSERGVWNAGKSFELLLKELQLLKNALQISVDQ